MVLLMAMPAVTARCQAATPTFEVATVKPQDPRNHALAAVNYPTPRRFEGTGSLQTFIELAYGIKGNQVIGGPKWMGVDIFDINAQADTPLNAAVLKEMLKALLADRFGLAVHVEDKPMPVFELAVDKGGLKLHSPADGLHRWSSGNGFIRGQMSIGELGAILSPIVGRIVQDGTDRNEVFVIDLEWATNDDAPGPSLFTAVREQLGLRMAATKRSVNVLVIDRAERPSAN